MGEFDLDEIMSVIDEALGDSPTAAKSEIKTKPLETTVFETTEWEATEWTGVTRRMVNAQEVFGTGVPAVGLAQYEGFENKRYAHLDVPTVPTVYEPCLTALGSLVLSCATGLKTMLVGDTGTGKTSLAEFFAAKLGRPFARIQFDEFMDDQKLIGSLEVRGTGDGASETYFNKSELVRAMAYPSVACMDEFSRGPSHVTMLANPILDRGSVTVTTHDDSASSKVQAVDDFFICATDNTNGTGDDMDLYNSSNVLDEAIRNRFDLYERVPYPSESVEREIIKQFTQGKLDDDLVRQLAHFSAMCHKGYTDRKIRTAFSIRNLKAISELMLQGVSVKDAIRFNFYNRVSKSEQPDIAEVVRSIFGE